MNVHRDNNPDTDLVHWWMLAWMVVHLCVVVSDSVEMKSMVMKMDYYCYSSPTSKLVACLIDSGYGSASPPASGRGGSADDREFGMYVRVSWMTEVGS